ncbi:MAG: hypothetical protein WD066_03435 [Planctomycetaceae bacterium]
MAIDNRATTMPDPIRVLLWGDPTPVEMRPVALHLLSLPVAIVPSSDTFGIDRAAFPLDDEPDLVVALQSWPDEFPRTVVERAIARFPLARWVCCYGEWCASDGRSRDIWPPGARVPVASARSRIARELAVIRGDLSPLPPTASRDEVFAFDRRG